MDGMGAEIARLKELAKAAPEIQAAALKEIGVRQLSWAQQDFKKRARGGEAAGASWKPDLKATIAARARRLGSYKGLKTKAAKQAFIDKAFSKYEIGVDTGRLINSLNAGSDGNVFDLSKDSVKVGTNLEYAEYFDAQRPIFGSNFIDGTRQGILEKIVEKYIEKAIKEGG